MGSYQRQVIKTPHSDPGTGTSDKPGTVVEVVTGPQLKNQLNFSGDVGWLWPLTFHCNEQLSEWSSLAHGHATPGLLLILNVTIIHAQERSSGFD